MTLVKNNNSNSFIEDQYKLQTCFFDYYSEYNLSVLFLFYLSKEIIWVLQHLLELFKTQVSVLLHK